MKKDIESIKNIIAQSNIDDNNKKERDWQINMMWKQKSLMHSPLRLCL